MDISGTFQDQMVEGNRGTYGFGKGKFDFFEGDLSADQIVEKAGLDWKVVKRPVSFRKESGSTKVIPGKFALVRDRDESFLSLCSAVYKPVQNDRTFAFMKRFTDAGHMKMRAAGDLCGGQYVWGLAEVGDTFTLPGKDKVGGYLLVVSPHVAGRSWIAKHISMRFACWNQFPSVLSDATNQAGRGRVGRAGSGTFKMPHSLEFTDEVADAAEEALGLSRKKLSEFKAAAEALVEKKFSVEQSHDYFRRVLKIEEYAPSAVLEATLAATNTEAALDAVLGATEEAAGKVRTRKSPVYVKMQEALETAPGQNTASAKGTAWGAFNAVTYVLEHQVCTDPDRRLRDNWLGGRATQKQEALQVALSLAA